MVMKTSVLLILVFLVISIQGFCQEFYAVEADLSAVSAQNMDKSGRYIVSIYNQNPSIFDLGDATDPADDVGWVSLVNNGAARDHYYSDVHIARNRIIWLDNEAGEREIYYYGLGDDLVFDSADDNAIQVLDTNILHDFPLPEGGTARYESIEEIAISPDGRWVVCVVTDWNIGDTDIIAYDFHEEQWVPLAVEKLGDIEVINEYKVSVNNEVVVFIRDMEYSDDWGTYIRPVVVLYDFTEDQEYLVSPVEDNGYIVTEVALDPITSSICYVERSLFEYRIIIAEDIYAASKFIAGLQIYDGIVGYICDDVEPGTYKIIAGLEHITEEEVGFRWILEDTHLCIDQYQVVFPVMNSDGDQMYDIGIWNHPPKMDSVLVPVSFYTDFTNNSYGGILTLTPNGDHRIRIKNWDFDGPDVRLIGEFDLESEIPFYREKAHRIVVNDQGEALLVYLQGKRDVSMPEIFGCRLKIAEDGAITQIGDTFLIATDDPLRDEWLMQLNVQTDADGNFWIGFFNYEIPPMSDDITGLRYYIRAIDFVGDEIRLSPLRELYRTPDGMEYVDWADYLQLLPSGSDGILVFANLIGTDGRLMVSSSMCLNDEGEIIYVQDPFVQDVGFYWTSSTSIVRDSEGEFLVVYRTPAGEGISYDQFVIEEGRLNFEGINQSITDIYASNISVIATDSDSCILAYESEDGVMGMAFDVRDDMFTPYPEKTLWQGYGYRKLVVRDSDSVLIVKATSLSILEGAYLRGELSEYLQFFNATPEDMFIRGDSNGNRKVGLVDSGIDVVGDARTEPEVIVDALHMLGYLFVGTEAPAILDAADTNDDGILNITDPIFLLIQFFRADEPAIPQPFPKMGQDPTPDDLQG